MKWGVEGILGSQTDQGDLTLETHIKKGLNEWLLNMIAATILFCYG